ncbi:MAG: hypothetical protein FJ388_05465, partial [Verrucomicrobia bacterium]|nr:hypothetical protein [Verrucomicrobiota bacterium]
MVVTTAHADEQTAPAVATISRLTVELPNLQCPMSLIVDDPKPIYEDRLLPEQLARRKADGKGVD